MKRAILKRLLPLISYILVQGCATTPPPIQEYLLRTEPPTNSARASHSAGDDILLKPIWVAPYLDRRGIVVQTAPHQLTEARYQIWAEPLTTALRRVLQVTIGQSTERPVRVDNIDGNDQSISVDVQIFRLHGDMDGNVTLVAEWILSKNGNTGTRFQFTRNQTTKIEGYEGLVDTYLLLAQQLGSAIGNSIQRYSRSHP